MKPLHATAAQILLLIGLMLIVPGRAGVHAQAGPLVQIAPEQSQINAGQVVTLALQITGGENVNAFDMSVRYDPAVLALESYSHGSYLANMVEVKTENQPGYFRLAATQLASTPVSGDGVLLNLVFRGTAEGSSPVTLESAQLAGADGATMLPAMQNGSIEVAPAPVETAAPEPTIALSPTFTIQPSPTAQLTSIPPTPIPPTPTPLPASTTPPVSTTAPTVTPFSTATTALPTVELSSPTPEPIATLTNDSLPTQDAPAAPPATEASPTAAPAAVREADRLPPILQWLEIVLWSIVMVCIPLSIYMLVVLIKRRK